MKTKELNIIQNPAVIFTVNPEPVERLTDRQILNRLQKLADAERRKAEAEAEIKALKEELHGGQALDRETDAFKVKYTPYEKKQFDGSRFKADHPKLYEQYQKTVQSSSFTYKIK